ncbi:hypothetical protein F1544_11720, partial [Kineosporiaceae bacterium B12]|nr:hypothetical protein [Kineococcus rubinsiae]
MLQRGRRVARAQGLRLVEVPLRLGEPGAGGAADGAAAGGDEVLGRVDLGARPEEGLLQQRPQPLLLARGRLPGVDDGVQGAVGLDDPVQRPRPGPGRR